MARGSGLLLHISSLKSDYMIGALDEHAYEFIDFLESSGMKYWQVLPLSPTGYGDSPYQSYSAFACNEYFISLDKLEKIGLLTSDEIKSQRVKSDRVDYSYLYDTRYEVLRKAYERFDNKNEEFLLFTKDQDVYDYAMFRAIKSFFNEKELQKWDDNYKFRDTETLRKFELEHKRDIEFWCFCQYMFLLQWLELKKYANDKNIKIIGDMPIYVSGDSVEVWTHPEMFILNSDLTPKLVAGVPPDCFTEDGQLWGNPIYNFKQMKKNKFSWWVRRLNHSSKYFDILRIDHFRGFSAYYSVKAKYKNARKGKWVNAPGYQLFDEIKSSNIKMDIIAEDLGFIDKKARKFFSYVGYPGMKIIQFAFDGNSDNEHAPQNSTENYVVYTGTHDNETLYQSLKSMNENKKEKYISALSKTIKDLNLDVKYDKNDLISICDAVIEIAFASVCNIAIIPMQDFLHEDETCRMNLPSTVSTNNWSYRAKNNSINRSLTEKIKKLNTKYDR